MSGDSVLSEARVRFLGEGSNDQAGYAVANAGDLDGDGLNDIAVSAPSRNGGVTYLVTGPVSGTLSLDGARATLVGEGSSDYAGRAIAGVGDTDGDVQETSLVECLIDC